MSEQREFEIALQDGRAAVIRGLDSASGARIAEMLGLGGGSAGGHEAVEPAGGYAAWGAFAAVDGIVQPVGLAQYVEADHEGAADVEVCVAETFRGVGLGRLLFDTLTLNAVEHGFDTLVARVTRNSKVARRLGREGSEVRGAGSAVHVAIPVNSRHRTLRASSALARVRRSSP